MKKITYAAFENYIQNCRPGCRIERRDGKDIGIVPDYNFNTDESTVYEYELIEDSEQPKFQAGQTLVNPTTGAVFTIVDPMAAMLSLRKGAERKDV